MDRSRLHGFNSPLSPIPPMKKSPFDFSLQPVKSEVLSPTSDKFNISIGLSPIKSDANTSMQKLNTTTSEDDIDLDRFNARLESLLDEKNEDFLNKTNINNRRLTVGTILEDLGLKQYETLMKEMDLLSFLTLTDDDLIGLGVENPNHRETLKSATKMFCEV